MKDKIQAVLPSGINVVDETPVCSVMGVSYNATDSRFDGTSFGRAVTAVITDSSGVWRNGWEAEFSERLEVLATTSFRNVARPLEVITIDEESICVSVSDHRDQSLASYLRENELSMPAKLDLIAQLANGMAELHASGLFHGSLSERVISVCRVGGNRVTLKLVDVEWSPGLFWSDGVNTDDDLVAHLPASSDGIPVRPTEKNDLYGLGSVVFGILTGSPLGDMDNNKLLTEVKTPGYLANDVMDLLSDNPSRSAGDLSESLRMSSVKQEAIRRIGRKPLTAIVSVVVLIVLFGMYSFITLGHEITTLEKDNANLKADATESADAITKLNEKIAALEGQIAGNESNGPVLTPDPTVEPLTKEEIHLIAHTTLATFGEDNIWKQTFAATKAKLISTALKNYGSVPNKSDLTEAIKSLVDNYQIAADHWARESRKKVSWNEFKENVAKSAAISDNKRRNTGVDLANSRALVDEWIYEFDQKKTYTIKLERGKLAETRAKPGKEFHVSLEGSNSPKLDFEWSSPKPFDEKHKLKISQEDGEVSIYDGGIGIELECDYWIWYRGPVTDDIIEIDTAFKGPLAIWKMAVAGKIRDKQGNEISWTVLDCPGPPVDVTLTAPDVNTLLE